MDHLLPKVPEAVRNDLYKGMCSMLEATTEDGFNRTYERLKTIHVNNKGVLRYIKQGWARENSPWKPMWPR